MSVGVGVEVMMKKVAVDFLASSTFLFGRREPSYGEGRGQGIEGSEGRATLKVHATLQR